MKGNMAIAKKDFKKMSTLRDRPFFVQLRKDTNILKAMVKQNFKAQYRNSILGVLWTVLNPLLNMIVLSIVFSQFFNRDGALGCYPVYLLCGNLIFNVLRQVTTKSLDCLVRNSGLIKKVKISYAIFPVSNMFTALVNFGVAFIALIIVMIILGQPFHWTMPLVVTIIPAVLLFSVGVGFFLSSMFVFFRDVKHLYEVFITLWLYITPIFYGVKELGGGFVGTIISLNPMTHYVTAMRDVVQYGAIPSGIEFLICYAWAIGMCVIGYSIFKACRKKYILYI